MINIFRLWVMGEEKRGLRLYQRRWHGETSKGAFLSAALMQGCYPPTGLGNQVTC
jgi:hypothetical protein